MNAAQRLYQHFTPDWAAHELVERFFGDLDADDRPTLNGLQACA